MGNMVFEQLDVYRDMDTDVDGQKLVDGYQEGRNFGER